MTAHLRTLRKTNTSPPEHMTLPLRKGSFLKNHLNERTWVHLTIADLKKPRDFYASPLYPLILTHPHVATYRQYLLITYTENLKTPITTPQKPIHT